MGGIVKLNNHSRKLLQIDDRMPLRISSLGTTPPGAKNVNLTKPRRVISARRGLMIEGGTTLRGVDILYRSVLLPLSEDDVLIDQVLGAANYRSLRNDESLMRQGIVRTQWVSV
jgi:hypothetical protein